MPMETTLETQALCLDHGAITNAMVRAEVNNPRRRSEYIISTGASDIVLSHSVIHRCCPYEIVPTAFSFDDC